MTCILIWGENWEAGDRGGEGWGGDTHSQKHSENYGSSYLKDLSALRLQAAPSKNQFTRDTITKKIKPKSRERNFEEVALLPGGGDEESSDPERLQVCTINALLHNIQDLYLKKHEQNGAADVSATARSFSSSSCPPSPPDGVFFLFFLLPVLRSFRLWPPYI